MAAKSFYDLGLTYSISNCEGECKFRIDPNSAAVTPTEELNRVFDDWRYVMTVMVTEDVTGFTASTEVSFYLYFYQVLICTDYISNYFHW